MELELGKTSTIEYVRKYFENKGYDVFIVNEVPTMLLNDGFNSSRCGKLNFLELIINVELYLASILEKEAKNSMNKNKIIFFDKCPIDNMVFIEREELDYILEKFNTSYSEIMSSYDLIIHLETVAKNYPELYNNENNKNRTLDKNLAIKRNDRLLDAYSKSDKRVVIDSYKDIKVKYNKVIEEIEKMLVNN